MKRNIWKPIISIIEQMTPSDHSKNHEHPLDKIPKLSIKKNYFYIDRFQENRKKKNIKSERWNDRNMRIMDTVKWETYFALVYMTQHELRGKAGWTSYVQTSNKKKHIERPKVKHNSQYAKTSIMCSIFNKTLIKRSVTM